MKKSMKSFLGLLFGLYKEDENKRPVDQKEGTKRFFSLMLIAGIVEGCLISSILSGRLVFVGPDIFNTGRRIPLYVPIFGLSGGVVHLIMYSARRYRKKEILEYKFLGDYTAKAMVAPLLAIVFFCLISLILPAIESIEVIAGLCFIIGLYVRFTLRLLLEIGRRLLPLPPEEEQRSGKL